MRWRIALLSSMPLDSSVTSNRAPVVAFEHLRHQLARRMDVEVGREIADAQAPAMRTRGAARQRPVLLRGEECVVARHLELLERIVDQHCVRERAGLDRDLVRHRPYGGAQAADGVVGDDPPARLTLQEDELPARCKVARAPSPSTIAVRTHSAASAFMPIALNDMARRKCVSASSIFSVRASKNERIASSSRRLRCSETASEM